MSDYADTWREQGVALERLGFPNYTAYLKSKVWASNRKLLLGLDYFKTCCVCGDKFAVHLHHAHYRYLGPLVFAPNYIFPLCSYHHMEMHHKAKRECISVEEATHELLTKYKAKLLPTNYKRGPIVESSVPVGTFPL